jgi:beta-glucosidase
VGSKVPRPAQELKAFRRITLEPGQKKTVQMAIAAADLRFWNEAAGGWELENDQVEIRVGPSSADCAVKTTLPVGGRR